MLCSVYSMTSSQRQTQFVSDSDWPDWYQTVGGCYDEYLTDSGQPRPHWTKLKSCLNSISLDVWNRREQQLKRLIEDNGITYNVYSHSHPASSDWAMDMIPFMLPESDYRYLESALSQRADLLNVFLEDFYGRQSILQNGHVDPFLVYANPAFNRACHGLLAKGEKYLNIYAADVARSSDGKWWVVSDRVEATSGLGYALDNRLLLSRILPNTLNHVGTKRLLPFVGDFCKQMENLAKFNRHNPHIALLSPGPKNETYYEHSFLARNLGFTLAEGADLTVRNNRLYMKTIGGTQQIDVLLRRVDSEWTDPLEMRNDSLLGVPGLVNCVRQGNLKITNALGSSFAETPANLAFLPWLAHNYLSEQLEIPSVATWWCGQPSEREYVLDRLDSLVIKPTFRNYNSRSYFGPNLSGKELDQLRADIIARPGNFCGQEILRSSTTPVYNGTRLEPRPYLLRVFLVSDSKGGWKMMPGGFARCAPDTDQLCVSMQTGGGSKDVWVVPDAPSEAEIKPPNLTTRPVELDTKLPERRHFDLPSRTANNLFWLGRYIARAEIQARLLRTTISLLLEEQLPNIQRACLPFCRQLERSLPAPTVLTDPSSGQLNSVQIDANIKSALNDPANPDSLVKILSSIERITESLKDRLSMDSWKRIQTIRQLASSAERLEVSIYDQESYDFLESALEHLGSLIGDITENMMRSQSWIFMQMGRHIERGITTAQILDEVFHSQEELSETLLRRILDLSDCSITYRRRYLDNLNAAAVLDMLVFDTTNPRSLIFQADSLRELLKKLPHATTDSRHPIDTYATQLFSQIGMTNSEELLEYLADDETERMHDFFAATIEKFTRLSVMVETDYFAHTQAIRPRTRSIITE